MVVDLSCLCCCYYLLPLWLNNEIRCKITKNVLYTQHFYEKSVLQAEHFWAKIVLQAE
jgi:hypothetical protein